MSFSIVEGEGRTFWAATDGSSTYYKGQLVSYTAASKAQTYGTVVPLAVPAGVTDITNFQIIAGVVVGFNRRTPQYTTVGSISCEYDTGVATQAALLARDYTGQEGMYSKGDPQVLVQIAEITSSTIIRGPFYNAAYGTAITVLTNTAADTTGGTSAFTTNATQFTPTTLTGTTYCRTGANMGLYRVNTDTSTTAPSNTVAFPYDIAVGDTFVRVPMKQGFSKIYIAGPGLYIGASLGLVTNTFEVICYKLNLAEAGKEYAEFRFTASHFDYRQALS